MNKKTDLSRLAAEVLLAQDAALNGGSCLSRVKRRLEADLPQRRSRRALWLIVGTGALSVTTVWALVGPLRGKPNTAKVLRVPVGEQTPKASTPKAQPPPPLNDGVAAPVDPTPQPRQVEVKRRLAQRAPLTHEPVARTPDELLDAADHARAKGSPEMAADALTEFVARFPHDARIAVAWFTLGRVLAALGRHAEAASAYAACLTASDGGPLREDAAAATAFAWVNAGNAQRAQQAAHEYLRLYPRGAFAGRIERLLHPE